MNRGKEIARGLIGTRCDSSILLQSGKEILDQMPGVVRPDTDGGRTCGAPSCWVSVVSRRPCRLQPAVRAHAHRHRTPCRRSARPPAYPAKDGRRPPGHAPRRRSGGSRSDCPGHRPGCVYLGTQSATRAPDRLVFVGFFPARTMLVGTHDGAVDHCVFIVCVTRQMLKNQLPHSGFRPAAEASMDIVPGAEAFQQVAPGDAGSVSEQHRRDEQPIVCRGHPPPSLPARATCP